MIDRALLSRCAAAFGVEVDAALAERFDTYARLLIEWNEKMNLTAITDPPGIAVKHFADSLTAAPLLPAGEISLIDVGTGAGFPGVPLALLRGDIRLTLLDSLNKRLIFLDALCRELALPVTLIHARAEEGSVRVYVLSAWRADPCPRRGGRTACRSARTLRCRDGARRRGSAGAVRILFAVRACRREIHRAERPGRQK